MTMSSSPASSALVSSAGVLQQSLQLRLPRFLPFCRSGSHANAAVRTGWCSRTLKCKERVRRITIAAEAASPELVPPPIDNDLHDILRDIGVQDGVVQTFGKDEEALKAAESSCAVIELSHFGRLRVTGDDRMRFLHNQSTADFLSLKEGQGCDTVFVTHTARTIDLATAWAMKTAVLLLVSPNTRNDLTKTLNKYIFFSDKVEVEDITEKTSFLSLVGPGSHNIMKQLNLEVLIGKPYGTHVHYTANGTPVTVGVGSGLHTEGYSFLLSPSAAGLVWESVIKAGAVPMGAVGWERLRILQGRPAAGQELMDEYNVLEAGLWKTISLSKGCYIGQETVARLITYNGVKQQLWGIKLEEPAEPGTVITADGVKVACKPFSLVGKLTSCTKGLKVSQYFGLAYIRTQAGGAGLKVDVGGVTGTVVDVPYLTRCLPVQ